MTAAKSPPGLALLIVDVQDVFLRALPAAGTPLTRRCAFVAAAAQLLKIPTAITEQVPAKLGVTNTTVREAAGSKARVFAKSAFSAFGAEGLGEWLREQSAAHLLVAGLETPICVYLTVLDAIAEDFEATVLVDATGGRRPDDFPPVHRLLESAGARLLPSETVFYSILRDATHPRFRDFTALVKQYA